VPAASYGPCSSIGGGPPSIVYRFRHHFFSGSTCSWTSESSAGPILSPPPLPCPSRPSPPIREGENFSFFPEEVFFLMCAPYPFYEYSFQNRDRSIPKESSMHLPFPVLLGGFSPPPTPASPLSFLRPTSCDDIETEFPLFYLCSPGLFSFRESTKKILASRSSSPRSCAPFLQAGSAFFFPPGWPLCVVVFGPALKKLKCLPLLLFSPSVFSASREFPGNLFLDKVFPRHRGILRRSQQAPFL